MRSQLLEDGVYPEAGRRSGQSATEQAKISWRADSYEDQPRDPQGRWTIAGESGVPSRGFLGATAPPGAAPTVVPAHSHEDPVNSESPEDEREKQLQEQLKELDDPIRGAPRVRPDGTTSLQMVPALPGGTGQSNPPEISIPPGMLSPGPFARDPLPVSRPGRPTAQEQEHINIQGPQFECHACGSKTSELRWIREVLEKGTESMKIISSLGGPLIGLPIGFVHLWGGADRKGFFGPGSSFSSDYEAAGFLTDGRNYPPRDIAVVHGTAVDGILLTMPVETCILSSRHYCVRIAQIHYANHDWSFEEIDTSLFENVKFDESEDLYSCGGEYVLFDSVFSGTEIESSLSFALDKGAYVLSSTHVKQEQCLFSLMQLRSKKTLEINGV